MRRGGPVKVCAVVDAGVAAEEVPGGVEKVGLSAAAERDVAGLAGEGLRTPKQGDVDGDALSLVSGQGVPVGEVTSGEVVPVEVDLTSVVESDSDRLALPVQVGDGASGASGTGRSKRSATRAKAFAATLPDARKVTSISPASIPENVSASDAARASAPSAPSTASIKASTWP